MQNTALILEEILPEYNKKFRAKYGKAVSMRLANKCVGSNYSLNIEFVSASYIISRSVLICTIIKGDWSKEYVVILGEYLKGLAERLQLAKVEVHHYSGEEDALKNEGFIAKIRGNYERTVFECDYSKGIYDNAVAYMDELYEIFDELEDTEKLFTFNNYLRPKVGYYMHSKFVYKLFKGELHGYATEKYQFVLEDERGLVIGAFNKVESMKEQVLEYLEEGNQYRKTKGTEQKSHFFKNRLMNSSHEFDSAISQEFFERLIKKYDIEYIEEESVNNQFFLDYLKEEGYIFLTIFDDFFILSEDSNKRNRKILHQYENKEAAMEKFIELALKKKEQRMRSNFKNYWKWNQKE